MADDKLASDLIERIYAVAIEPERFEELAEFWHERLSKAAKAEFGNFADLVNHLEEHAHRADTILSMTTSGLHALPASMREQLNADPHACLAFDTSGHVRAVNEAAHLSFGLGVGAKLSDMNFDDQTTEDLSRAISGVLSSDGEKSASILVRARNKDDDRQNVIAVSKMITASGLRLALLKTAEFVWPSKLDAIVQAAFGLTEAETDIVRLLTIGLDATAIAERRSASITTVRSQLRTIYEKTETRNQSELLRMALAMTRLNLVERDQESDAAVISELGLRARPYPRPEDRRMLTVADGRILDYACFGASDGRPVVFHHTEFFGDGWPAEMVREAERLHLRIIAPARPGNGRSTVIPDDQNALTTFAHDLSFLLDKLHCKTAVHVSQMAGTQFALAHTNLYPDRSIAHVIVAPIFPFDAGVKGARPPYFHRILASALNSQAGIIRFLSKAGLAYFNRVGPEQFFLTFARGREIDVSTVRTRTNLEAMMHGAKICGAQGYLGYFSDYRDKIEDPMPKFLNPDVPLWVLIGEDIPKQENMNLQLVLERHTCAQEVIAQNGGSYLFYSHPQLVLDTIVEAFEAQASS